MVGCLSLVHMEWFKLLILTALLLYVEKEPEGRD